MFISHPTSTLTCENTVAKNPSDKYFLAKCTESKCTLQGLLPDVNVTSGTENFTTVTLGIIVTFIKTSY